MLNSKIVTLSALLAAVSTTMIVPTSSVAAEISSSACKKLHIDYQDGALPKAFALSSNGKNCGYATAKTCGKRVNCVKKKALKFCSKNGEGCKIIDVKKQ
jgi:hypothetical protein